MFPQAGVMTDRLDRRRGSGRRSTDGYHPLAFRGLLHDIEHGLATLSALLEVVRGDRGISADSVIQLDRAQRELSMLFGFIARWSAGSVDDGSVDGPATNVRAMAGEIAPLAEIEHGVPVEMNPGPEVTLPVTAELLWRVLANMVDNAARAAGPAGRVEMTVLDRPNATVIEVTDNGPGFGDIGEGNSPLGDRESLGLSVITSLLHSVGGHFEISEGSSGGTTVRAVFRPQTGSGTGERQGG